MRLQYGTLDHLSSEIFIEETKMAKAAEQLEPGCLRRLAASNGDEDAYDDWQLRGGPIYRATQRPVSFCTLPENVGWEFVHRPGSAEGGRYGVIRISRALTPGEIENFSLVDAS